MSLVFQNVFAILATFECLSIWKFDEYSGRNLVITPEAPIDRISFPKPSIPISEIKGADINVPNLSKALVRLVVVNIRHWFSCVLPMSIKRICRLLLFKAVQLLIWTYNGLTFVLKWTVVITVPALSLSYLFQRGCKGDEFLYPDIVSWFIVVKIGMLIICRCLLAKMILHFTEVPGGKGIQKEDSSIIK